MTLNCARAVASASAVVAAVIATVIADTRPDRAAALTWAWVAGGFGESVVAVAALGVRQWRFAPRPRAIASTMTAGASLVLLLVPSALADGAWWAVPTVACMLLVALLLAREPARLARASVPTQSVRSDVR